MFTLSTFWKIIKSVLLSEVHAKVRGSVCQWQPFCNVSTGTLSTDLICVHLRNLRAALTGDGGRTTGDGGRRTGDKQTTHNKQLKTKHSSLSVNSVHILNDRGQSEDGGLGTGEHQLKTKH
jgi:hypothetical protein